MNQDKKNRWNDAAKTARWLYEIHELLEGGVQGLKAMIFPTIAAVILIIFAFCL
jgi:hypothetical protein